jgi:thiol-disulfide isomerase/thioredoxin
MSNSRRWWVIGGVVAVLTVALAAAFASGEPEPVEDPVGTVSITGTPLARLEDPASDPAVGQVAPQAVGADFDGSEVRIEPTGEPTVVVFVAHWCPSCQAEVPRIVALAAAGGTEGVRLVAVATANDPLRPNYPASEWLDREGWPAPVLVDDEASSLAMAFGLSAYPFFAVLDGEGNVMFRVTGELDADSLALLFSIARDA